MQGLQLDEIFSRVKREREAREAGMKDSKKSKGYRVFPVLIREIIVLQDPGAVNIHLLVEQGN